MRTRKIYSSFKTPGNMELFFDEIVKEILTIRLDHGVSNFTMSEIGPREGFSTTFQATSPRGSRPVSLFLQVIFQLEPHGMDVYFGYEYDTRSKFFKFAINVTSNLLENLIERGFVSRLIWAIERWLEMEKAAATAPKPKKAKVYCKNCGYDLPDEPGLKICPQCGIDL
ncbi:MAG: hypothetical protein ACFFCS_10565 [Candidatus Hodarchaeota archaeon]